MHPLAQFISAVVLTYFVSRLIRRFPLGDARIRRVLLTHCIAFPLMACVLVLVHGFAGALASHSILFLALAQVLWLVLDGMRAGSAKRTD